MLGWIEQTSKNMSDFHYQEPRRFQQSASRVATKLQRQWMHRSDKREPVERAKFHFTVDFCCQSVTVVNVTQELS